MKDKIITKATEMFLKLGFKSVTMDDIACEMCISKKTIYKFFSNKESLVQEATQMMHERIHTVIDAIIAKNFNAIQENFEIRRLFKEMFQSLDNSPVYQLKRHYPSIYDKILEFEIEACNEMFGKNIHKGIEEGLYRKEVDIQAYIKFYYILIFSINENTPFESEAIKLEMEALEYHTRALATPKGIEELEKQLQIHNN